MNAFCARRIVRTESAYVANAAQSRAYDEAGLEHRARDKDGNTVRVPADLTYEDWRKEFVEGEPGRTYGSAKPSPKYMSNVGNTWAGAEPTKHTAAELAELNQYAADRGIKLYTRKAFDGDAELLKSQIDTLADLREEFKIKEPLQLGWKRMDPDDFGETSPNHQQIWINELAMRNRGVTEKNLAVDNYLATNSAEGIAAHEMGHVISGKIRNGKSGLDIYKETVYNVSGKRVSDDEAIQLLLTNVSVYSAYPTMKSNGTVVYGEVISEMLSVNHTNPNKYSSEFVRLLKEACGL